MKLSAANIAGQNTERGRAQNDFYATNPEAIKALLEKEAFPGSDFLEPCVGMGHIAREIKEKYPQARIDCLDIVDRGYPETIKVDFLQFETPKKYDAIITNPPYSLATEFIQKSAELVTENGKIAMFLKLQFLEGEKRRLLFEQLPPKTIWVFRKRMPTWRDGKPKDENGKNWATTICHAWFVWEAGEAKENPSIKWI